MSEPDPICRVRFSVAGVHVHCRLFCAPRPNTTFAKCGDFTVRRGKEFAALLAAFDGADFLADQEGIGIVTALKAENVD